MKNKLIQLEKKMITYKNLLPVLQIENKEVLVPLNSVVLSGYKSGFNDMEKILGKTIFVRQTIAMMLTKAQANLKKDHPTLALYVTYGYRSLEIQTQLFCNLLQQTTTFFPNPEDLYEEIHRYVAVPNVAGHPTGGAIDIVLYDEKQKTFLDFGADQYDFSKESCYVFSPTISQKGKKNRQLLRTILTSVGFAPFDGEWWHFSFGDREWAYYYQQQARYSQIPVSRIAQFML